MPPKKRKTAPQHQEKSSSKKQKARSVSGSLENASNSERGLLVLPGELRTKTLGNFSGIYPLTEAPSDSPVLSGTYLERTDALRALSQVCVAYRRDFLPLLWDSLTACCSARSVAGIKPGSFYKHNGEALLRKCAGLCSNPALASFVRYAHVILTRYQAATLIPTFSASLLSLPNLHTLHVLHAHTQMTTAIKRGFEGVTLPHIRTVIIPGNCHEILRSCPQVTTVRCTSDDGSKLISVIAKHCKQVEEMRGFGTEENLMKRIVKAAPNLRIFDMRVQEEDTVLKYLPSFKKFNTLIVRTPMKPKEGDVEYLQKCIKDCISRFKDLPPVKDKKRIRIWHFYTNERGCPSHSEGFFSEVDLES